MEPEIQFIAGKLTFNSVKRITSSIHWWSCFNLVHRNAIFRAFWGEWGATNSLSILTELVCLFVCLNSSSCHSNFLRAATRWEWRNICKLFRSWPEKGFTRATSLQLENPRTNNIDPSQHYHVYNQWAEKDTLVIITTHLASSKISICTPLYK